MPIARCQSSPEDGELVWDKIIATSQNLSSCMGKIQSGCLAKASVSYANID